jgi:type IV pilus assembly protein PilO
MAPPAQQSTLAKLNTPAKVGIGAVFVVLIGLVYWVVFYSDISAKITTANAAKNKAKSDLATAEQEKATYLADKEDLNARQQRQRDLNKALPPDTEAAGFLSSLQQAANVSGIELKTWTPEEEKVDSFYAKFPMKLEMRGRFHQVAKFAYEVGRVERIINVENIELSDPKLEGDEVMMQAKCRATTFHTVKAQPAASGRAAVAPGQAPPPAPANTTKPGGK